MAETYNIGWYQHPRSQHINPESHKNDQILPGDVIVNRVKDRIEEVKPGKHGEQNGVKITGDFVFVFSPEQLPGGSVTLDNPVYGILYHEQQFERFLGVATSIV